MKSESPSVVSDSLWPHGLYSSWNSPGQNTGVSSLSLLQGIFPTQGSNPVLPLCRRILYQLSYKGNPRILEWVAYPFSRGIFLTQELNQGFSALRADSLPTELVKYINFEPQYLLTNGSHILIWKEFCFHFSNLFIYDVSQTTVRNININKEC